MLSLRALGCLDVIQINMSCNQMDTGLELQREAGTRETDMQCMGPQPSKPGGPLVRTEQSKDRTLEKKTHLSGWKGKQAQEMGDVRVKEAGGKKSIESFWKVKGNITWRRNQFKERCLRVKTVTWEVKPPQVAAF